MIGGFRSVLFVSRFKVRCFVIVLFRLPPSFDKNSTHHHNFLCYSWRSRVILSQAGRARYIVIFIKMIDGTEKPKIASKFAILAARYNAVIFIYVKQSIQKTDKWKYWFLRGGENRSTRRKILSGQG